MTTTNHGTCCGAAATADTAEAPRTRTSVFHPRADFVETPEGFVARLDVPGADAEAIDIQLDSGVLTVRAPVAARAGASTRWLAQEYGVGDWERTFRVGETIDANGISADYADGVLTIRLPKIAQVRQRKVAVNAAR